MIVHDLSQLVLDDLGKAQTVTFAFQGVACPFAAGLEEAERPLIVISRTFSVGSLAAQIMSECTRRLRVMREHARVRQALSRS
jgi:hypothetical protein